MTAQEEFDSNYVIVVHGTWNAPEQGQTKWYEPNGSFVQDLSRQLSAGKLAGSVWRGLDSKPIFFSCSVKNSHTERGSATRKLCALLQEIRAEDSNTRIHFVAHGHGGNVVLKALECILARFLRSKKHWSFL